MKTAMVTAAITHSRAKPYYSYLQSHNVEFFIMMAPPNLNCSQINPRDPKNSVLVFSGHSAKKSKKAKGPVVCDAKTLSLILKKVGTSPAEVHLAPVDPAHAKQNLIGDVCLFQPPQKDGPVKKKKKKKDKPRKPLLRLHIPFFSYMGESPSEASVYQPPSAQIDVKADKKGRGRVKALQIISYTPVTETPVDTGNKPTEWKPVSIPGKADQISQPLLDAAKRLLRYFLIEYSPRDEKKH